MLFNFELTESREGKQETDQYIIGNVLNFYRNSQSSKMEWSLGPLKGVFPVPAVGIDFTWLKLNWDKYVNGQKEPPLEKFIKNYNNS